MAILHATDQAERRQGSGKKQAELHS